MGACGSSVGDKFNQNEIDESHFEMHTTIGKGGFGHVHMVVKKSGDDKEKMYAQKRQIISDVCSKRMEMEVFRELDFLKDLNNVFICNAHYAFHDNTYLYLIMDIALGGDLRFHINKKLKDKKGEEGGGRRRKEETNEEVKPGPLQTLSLSLKSPQRSRRRKRNGSLPALSWLLSTCTPRASCTAISSPTTSCLTRTVT